ncbi:hypothetical protein CLV78_101224 [Aliiruegeria haliotis]|uniref:Uncharacterized protein n=1 Tax=Aliiruegeria haliotis TaxID=1280846 RepID=A0A2T0RY96_9RHOB|nr:hypothetical protein CLV78_101224 [Aliiruegeria haliotis]
MRTPPPAKRQRAEAPPRRQDPADLPTGPEDLAGDTARHAIRHTDLQDLSDSFAGFGTHRFRAVQRHQYDLAQSHC